MTKQNYRQCMRCVMDTSDPNITFDENGYCNHCTDYFSNLSKHTYQGKTSDVKVARLMEKIKKSGKKNKYDCLIGLSGGIDSCYTAYYVKTMGLRALLVHMDNGWDSEISAENIQKVVDKLGFDYINYKLSWDEFRDLQVSFLKASVPEIETPTDIAILAVTHKIAAENKIKYIISGGNFITEGILPKSWHYDTKDYTYIKAIQKQFGTRKLKEFPVFDYKREMYYKLIKGIRIIYILNDVDYNPTDALKLLKEQFGWKYYERKHYESVYTRFVQSYMLLEKFNIDYRKATSSSKICSGLMTREEAMEELKNKPYNQKYVDEQKVIICKKLEISTEEFDSIMQSPPKSHYDYPNAQKKLEFIYKVYKKLFRY